MAASITADRPKLEIGDLLTSPEQAARYQTQALAYQALLSAGFVAVAVGAAPVHVFIAAPLLYMRYALCVHELMHCRRGAALHPAIRLMPLAQSIVTLGYDQHRDIHLRHHAHLGTARDPESYLIEVGLLRATLRALFATEIVFARWVREKGMSRSLRLDALLRAALFLVLVVAAPGVFVLYFLGVRAGMALTELAFHHVLHRSAFARRGGLARLPPWLLGIAEILFGPDKLGIITYHDAHHENPHVAARHLAEVAGALTP